MMLYSMGRDRIVGYLPYLAWVFALLFLRVYLFEGAFLFYSDDNPFPFI